MSKTVEELKIQLANLENEYYDVDDELTSIRNSYEQKKSEKDTIEQEIRDIEDKINSLGEEVDSILI